MALTKEDLQAISELMDGKLKPLSARLDEVDVKLDNIGQRVTNIEIAQENIGQRVANIEITQENIIIPNTKLISEGIIGINDRLDNQTKIENKQEDHDNRIWALEQAVKAR